MHPAFSVILFTTLSGAGYGLWTWLGLRLALGPTPQRVEPALLAMLVLGAALVSVGLLASLWHLGKPRRAWRSFSQWRTSWLSREGVLAVLCFLPALVAGLLLLLPTTNGTALGLRIAGLLLIPCSLATVGCTAMIYASLKPIPAWRHGLVAPVYFGFALFLGALLHQTVLGGLGHWVTAAALGLLAVAVALLKATYWNAIDREPLPATRGDAVGLPGRTIDVFERPHTEANYLTREMGFVVARKHARKLRMIALLLFAVLPVVAILAALWLPALQLPFLVMATLAALAGTLVERWLFFAQARHLVTLYY